MAGNSGPMDISTKQQRIVGLARQMPEKAMTSLSHHMDLEWMIEAYRRTRKDGAVGIDGQTAKEYEANLVGNLRSLLDRAKSGDGYKAPPVRRVHIPKKDRTTCPLGIPTFEDKLLQRAVAMLLEPLYEQDSGVFIRVSAGAIGASGASGSSDEDMADGRRMGT